MGRSVRVGFVALLAICCLQDVASYNPYAYNPSYFPKTDSDSYSSMGDINWAKRGRQSTLQSLLEPDAYSSMGDINWAKRSRSGTLRSLLDQNYGYASMADANWGWKKRSDDNADYQSVPDVEALSTPKRGIQRSYKYRQPYMRARPRADRIQRYMGKRGDSQTLYQPYQAYARYGAISRPQTRKLGNRQYAFYSMADAPWGWKKRSELPALQDLNEENEGTNPMEEELEKRNVASMARSNMFPRKLRSYDEMRAGDENNLDLIEEKEEDTSNH